MANRMRKEERMRSKLSLAAVPVLLIWMCAPAVSLHAGTVEDIKEGSRQTAREIKEGTVEAGKAAAETGKNIKDGTQKAWKEVKEGVKEVGKDFKKAYQETRDAIRKEVAGEGGQARETQKKTD
jgi:gas vesicle protein